MTLTILTEQDEIRPDDFCRPLVPLNDICGDHSPINSRNAYSGTPVNNFKWCRVSQQFGDVWFGKKYGEMERSFVEMEFVRGEIPDSHVMKGLKNV